MASSSLQLLAGCSAETAALTVSSQQSRMFSSRLCCLLVPLTVLFLSHKTLLKTPVSRVVRLQFPECLYFLQEEVSEADKFSSFPVVFYIINLLYSCSLPV